MSEHNKPPSPPLPRYISGCDKVERVRSVHHTTQNNHSATPSRLALFYFCCSTLWCALTL